MPLPRSLLGSIRRRIWRKATGIEYGEMLDCAVEGSNGVDSFLSGNSHYSFAIFLSVRVRLE